jgi:hypothetical protein
MKITIKGARTQDEGRRAYNAAWHLGANAGAHIITDSTSGARWRFKLTRKGNVSATRIEAT